MDDDHLVAGRAQRNRMPCLRSCHAPAELEHDAHDYVVYSALMRT